MFALEQLMPRDAWLDGVMASTDSLVITQVMGLDSGFTWFGLESIFINRLNPHCSPEYPLVQGKESAIRG